MVDGGIERGVYEELLTSALEERLRHLSEGDAPLSRPLHDSEAADRFAVHVATAVRQALAAQPDKDRALVSSRVVAALLRELEAETVAYDARPDIPSEDPRVLTGIVHLNPNGTTPELHSPITPLLDTTVLTNSKQDLNMSAHLKSEIRSASDIDAIVAFISRPGVRPLLADLRRVVDDGHRVRILTTSFTGFTEVEALTMLAEAGAEIRVSYDTSSSRLHAKAWIFHRPGQSSTAFVGSSNFTSHALNSGMEWNVRLSQRRNPDAVEKMMRVFDSYWESDDFVNFDADEFRARASNPQPTPGSPEIQLFDIAAHPFQERMLEEIRVARELGHHRNLLVAATGTGKTVMAALDYQDLRRRLPRARLLFVAHREEILDQSLRTFRMVLGDAAFGEKWAGNYRPTHFEHVFASIQSLSRNGLTASSQRHFDVVIVDEFHHAAAATYERLLTKVAPTRAAGAHRNPGARGRPERPGLLRWPDRRRDAPLGCHRRGPTRPVPVLRDPRRGLPDRGAVEAGHGV